MSACWKSKPPWPEGFRRRIGSSLYSAGARHPASFNAFVQVPPKKDRVCDYILLIQYIYILYIYIPLSHVGLFDFFMFSAVHQPPLLYHQGPRL